MFQEFTPLTPETISGQPLLLHRALPRWRKEPVLPTRGFCSDAPTSYQRRPVPTIPSEIEERPFRWVRIPPDGTEPGKAKWYAYHREEPRGQIEVFVSGLSMRGIRWGIFTFTMDSVIDSLPLAKIEIASNLATAHFANGATAECAYELNPWSVERLEKLVQAHGPSKTNDGERS